MRQARTHDTCRAPGAAAPADAAAHVHVHVHGYGYGYGYGCGVRLRFRLQPRLRLRLRRWLTAARTAPAACGSGPGVLPLAVLRLRPGCDTGLWPRLGVWLLLRSAAFQAALRPADRRPSTPQK